MPEKSAKKRSLVGKFVEHSRVFQKFRLSLFLTFSIPFTQNKYLKTC